MKHRLILLAGVVTAALVSTAAMPAFADYDDQAEETRALNVQALADARGQSDAPMPAMGGVDAGDHPQDGVGGPLFEAAPGPNDMGDAPPDSDAQDGDEPDVSDEPEDTALPGE